MANNAIVHMVYKATIPATPGLHKVKFHRGYEQLRADTQHGHLAVWYRVPAKAEVVELDVEVVATGTSAPDPFFSRYIGTVILANGALVFHAFLVTTLEKMEAEAEEAAQAGVKI